MKKIVLSLAILLLLLTALPALSSCGIGSTVKDDFGFARPKDSWITECLLLPKEPVSDKKIEELGDFYTENADQFIKYEELWGESGENGLASEAAVAMDGQYAEDGDCWLVYLIYANTGIPDAVAGVNAEATCNITYLNHEMKMSSDRGGIRDYYGDLYGDVASDEWYVWCLEDGEKLSYTDKYTGLKNATAVDGALQGAIVFPTHVSWFGSIPECTLYAEISVRGLGAGTELIDDRDVYRFSDSEPEVVAEISDFSVRYLPWGSYHNGEYSDGDLTETAQFEDGTGCYAVLDLTMTALLDNDGTHTLDVLTNVSDARAVALNIEEAPTGKIEQIIVGTSGHSDYAAVTVARYTLPSKAGESKTARMVIRILPVLGGEYALNSFAIGDARTGVSGNSYVYRRINTGEPMFRFKLSDDKSSYVITELLNTDATTAIIPDTLGDGLPVTGFADDVFKQTNSIQHIVMGTNITFLPNRAFVGCWNVHTGTGLLSFTFDGTLEEWKQMSKNISWAFGSGLSQVTCSDGTITL